jgi:hypothetical protein
MQPAITGGEVVSTRRATPQCLVLVCNRFASGNAVSSFPAERRDRRAVAFPRHYSPLIGTAAGGARGSHSLSPPIRVTIPHARFSTSRRTQHRHLSSAIQARNALERRPVPISLRVRGDASLEAVRMHSASQRRYGYLFRDGRGASRDSHVGCIAHS